MGFDVQWITVLKLLHVGTRRSFNIKGEIQWCPLEFSLGWSEF